MRVPVSYSFAAVDFSAIAFSHNRAVRHFIAFFSTAEFVDQFQLGITRGNNQLLIAIQNELSVVQFQMTFVFHLNAGLCRRTRCRTTDVERTHRQLCTRFTDGLCRDNPDCLTLVDDVATSQVTTVAVCTHTEVGFTANNGTNLDDVNGVFF